MGRATNAYPSARIWAPWNLVMEDGSCLGPETDCYNVAPVRLGRGATVSQKSYLCTASHTLDSAFTLVGAPIELKAKAWIAARALIGPGVTLAEGAVVAAGAVVMKDVAVNTVVAGNPARPVSESALFVEDADNKLITEQPADR
ncbi:LbetaH domain-containing protein [Aurantiacibacter spongiae]|nr:hypothetical protein [Aurantiacibacter spongiae]